VPYSISAYEEEATPEYVSVASLIRVPDSVALTLFPDPVTVLTGAYNQLSSSSGYRGIPSEPPLPPTPPIQPRPGSVTPVQIHTPPSSPRPPINVPSPIRIYTPEPTPQSTPQPCRASSKTSTQTLPQADEGHRAHPSFVNQFPVETASRAVVESGLLVPRFLF
jgi:outer membrane biosynthesis protein TonB